MIYMSNLTLDVGQPWGPKGYKHVLHCVSELSLLETKQCLLKRLQFICVEWSRSLVCELDGEYSNCTSAVYCIKTYEA